MTKRKQLQEDQEMKQPYLKPHLTIKDIMRLMNFGHSRAKKVFLEAKKISNLKVIDIYEKVPLDAVLDVVGVRDREMFFNQQNERSKHVQ